MTWEIRSTVTAYGRKKSGQIGEELNKSRKFMFLFEILNLLPFNLLKPSGYFT
jgi:hypothetical protein